jgi:hypothetical protein
MHREYERSWLENKKKNVHVRSFQELDLESGAAGGTGVNKLLRAGQFSFPEANRKCTGTRTTFTLETVNQIQTF